MHRLKITRTFSVLLAAVAVIGLFSASVPTTFACTNMTPVTEFNQQVFPNNTAYTRMANIAVRPGSNYIFVQVNNNTATPVWARVGLSHGPGPTYTVNAGDWINTGFYTSASHVSGFNAFSASTTASGPFTNWKEFVVDMVGNTGFTGPVYLFIQQGTCV